MQLSLGEDLFSSPLQTDLGSASVGFGTWDAYRKSAWDVEYANRDSVADARREDDTMSVPKKSLISDRAVAKKAAIAKTSETPEAGALKANALTAHSMRKKSVRATTLKVSFYKAKK